MGYMKKPFVIGSIILGVGIVIGVGLVVRNTLIKKNTSATKPQSAVEVKPELGLWEDQAGFSFQYPKEVLTNKHDEDLENYAHIELTSATHSGRLIVWAKDTTYADVDAWVMKDKTLSTASVIDTTLGGKKAKKIILPEPSKKLITGTIDDQILFTIEAEPQTGDAFWQDAYATIVQSFTLTPMANDEVPADQSDTGGEASVDEEEVLE